MMKDLNHASVIVEATTLASKQTDLDVPDLLGSYDPSQVARLCATIPGGQANVQYAYPLSPLQEGLLFDCLMNERRDVYILSLGFELSSSSSVSMFVAAINRVFNRHEALRSAVIWETLQAPIQVVCRQITVPVNEITVEEDCDCITELDALTRPGSQRLDLTSPPLARVHLISSAHGGKSYALLQLHHLVCDHQSLDVIVSELFAHLAHQEAALEKPVAYRDYVAKSIQRAREADAETYFRSKLSDFEEPSTPFALGNTPRDESEFREFVHELDPSITSQISRHVRGRGYSAARLFHVAWGLVVAHTSGRDDVIYGTSLSTEGAKSGRSPPMVGLAINTLPLRLRLRNVNTRDILRQTHEELISFLYYTHTPLPIVQRAARLPPGTPLFATMLTYRHHTLAASEPHTAAGGVRLVSRRDSWTNYPIAFTVDELADGFRLTMQTDARIEPQRMIGYVIEALQSILRSTDEVPALALPILPLSERNRITQEFNPSPSPYPRDKLAHELFEAQVKRCPEAIAISYGEKMITFDQLNRNANRLARALLQAGSLSDRPIGLFVDRGLEMFVGILAILKAGCAYLPLDPSYPVERLQRLLNDAAPRVVLSQDFLRPKLPATNAAVILFSSFDRSAIITADDANLGRHFAHMTSRNLCYVIFTSGSTGHPKGVMVEHRDVLNLWHGLERLYAQSMPCERIALNASLSFDASVQQVVQLLSGRSVFVLPHEVRRDPRLLLDFVSQHSIHGVDCTPSQLRSWIASGLLRLLSEEDYPLRVLLVGGEALDNALWNSLARCSRLAVFNVYGPTECTVDATAAPLELNAPTPHLGGPMANRSIYILDPRNQLAPIGVIGEIHIAGSGVARGYWNRPDLTAERFVVSPFSLEEGARMYKTGDLGRWREDGTIEYLGRNDHQVKIRGFRIELGEVETHLASHPDVKDAIVLAREDSPGNRRLVAYATAREGQVLTKESLRAHLQERLPDYMAPTAFVILDRIPLTPSGKLDRRSLPSPTSDSFTTRQYEAPQGRIEQMLAQIWAEVLGIRSVGRQDNFFELGGHSLLSVQVIGRLNQLGFHAKVRDVFDAPTLAGLACAVSETDAEAFAMPPNLIPQNCTAIASDMLPLVDLSAQHIELIQNSVPGGAANIQDIYPLTPLQDGLLFHHILDEARGDTYVVPLLLTVDSQARLAQLTSVLQALVDRHDILRTAVLWEQLPLPVQVVYRRARVEIEDLPLDPNRDTQEQLLRLMEPERQRLSLSKAPVMRLRTAVDVRSQRYYLLIQLHHMLADSTSQQLLIGEIKAHLDGREHLLARPTPYRNHVARALHDLRTHDAERYFRAALEGIDEPTAPFGIRENSQHSSADETTEEMDGPICQGSRDHAKRLGVTVAALFHAAWSLVVSITSARDDVVFGTVLLGRLEGEKGTAPAMGMFINTLPIRIRLRGITVTELVLQTQRALADLIAHEQASLAVAQQSGGIVGTAPLFTSLLNYRQSSGSGEPSWSDLDGVRLVATRNATNYPIAVSIDDSATVFRLTAHSDPRISSTPITGYLRVAMEALLEALEHAPKKPALALPILPSAEIQLVTEAFNRTHSDIPQGDAVHELFERQVERSPGATAILHAEGSLTYTELNSEANQLARYLLELGVTPGDFLPVCMARSAQMLLAQLAVLKAGAVYVPLDPALPSDRLEFILRDCRAKVVLGDSEKPRELPIYDLQWINCTAVLDSIGRLDSQNLVRRCAVGPAYLMYTSGSSGRPKGVLVSHRAIVRLVLNNGYAEISSEDCVAHYSNPSFDASTFEIWGALLCGARLLIIPQHVVLSEIQFATSLSLMNVTVLWMSVGLFNQYVDSLAPVFSHLRYLIVGGDALDPSTIRRVLHNSPPLYLLNGYGPTECTTFSTTHLIRSVPTNSARIPIGRPLANTEIYILNEHYQPVPVGVRGEIHIGGAGLAYGYLNQPELTAERFVPHPFSSDPSARLYRTGDVGLWHGDGAVEFLGRNDNQVKVRGFRIEPGEIESHLKQHANVADAAVLALDDTITNEKRLVGYIVLSAPSADVGDAGVLLHDYLISRLPRHMVPDAFVILERLPLTSNGKLDRRALPGPDHNSFVSSVEYDQVHGDIEEALLTLWIELLQLDRIGRNDNFFEIGGHSLLALKALQRINQEFKSGMKITDLYRYPTIRELAERIRGTTTEDFVVDLSREATLDDRIVPITGVSCNPPRVILITGSTGFVGRFLLEQLLRNADATIYCLVRSPSQSQAMPRVRAQLEKWGLWRGEYAHRIVGFAGNLSLPHLGLDDASYDLLARTADCIYHCGSSMNHLETYAMAKPANVASVAELLKLATSHKPKVVNYISTLSVFETTSNHATRVVDEASSIDHEKHASSAGYGTSKWVAEKIFLKAQARGIPCNIFRLGLVWADSQQGRYDELQRCYRILKTCLLSGWGIRDYHFEMPPAPVDYVTQATVFLAGQHPDGGGIFHICSPTQMSEGILETCNRVSNTSLTLVPLYEWTRKIKQLHQEGLSLPAIPLIEYSFAMDEDSFHEQQRNGRSAATVHFEAVRTYAELEAAGIVAPTLNEGLLKLCLDDMSARDTELREARRRLHNVGAQRLERRRRPA